jgi:hypothetical protein
MNSHNYEWIYDELGIDLDDLGCIMLDVNAAAIKPFPDESVLHYTQDPKRFWIKGFVVGVKPHITLLYGLLESGTKWKKYVDAVLDGWKLKEVAVKEVGYFTSPYEDDQYYCIVAHIDITPDLLEGYYRLNFLPHVNTFPDYKAHMTLAYIKKDDKIRDEVIAYFNKQLVGEGLKIKGLNYGSKE